MARFHDLTVTNVRKTIRDAVIVTLSPDEPAAFAFTPGQFLTFRRDFDGTEIRRNYSICTAPGNGIEIGIKRVDGGAFSTWANQELTVGTRLQSMAPQGRFFSPRTVPPGGNVLAFAGGSGITPILSLSRSTLAADPAAEVTLVYANRAVSTIMFREEVEDLKNLYMGRLRVIHVLEHDAQDVDLFTGRIDAQKCGRLFASLIEVATFDCAFICGPGPMMETIAAALKAAGLPADCIHLERFTAPQQGRAALAAIPQHARDHAATARVRIDGSTRTVPVPPGTSLLDAARAAGLDAPFSCRAGICSTCRCRLLEGEVEMISNHALEDYEVAQGYRLSCQSYPLSDRIAIDYDL